MTYFTYLFATFFLVFTQTKELFSVTDPTRKFNLWRGTERALGRSISFEDVELFDTDEILIFLDQHERLTLAHFGLHVRQVENPNTNAYLESLELRDQRHSIGLLDIPIPAWDAYHYFEDMTQLLTTLNETCSHIMRLSSIGKSVEGRELWIVTLTDFPDQLEEDEPEFLWTGNIHGNEPVGKECMLRFLNEVCETYGTDDRITNLVSNTRIFMIPSINPDGFENNQRSNQNHIDLNRNFPERIYGNEDSEKGRQLESQHYMMFVKNHSISISATFHGGALVVNYPWDSNELGRQVNSPTPDDDIFIAVSNAYASNHGSMAHESAFIGGITNGAMWYVVRGGLQDYAYAYHSSFEVTLEIGLLKMPRGSDLPSYYGDNLPAMLSYMEMIHIGVRGIVICHGEPVDASIQMFGVDKIKWSNPQAEMKGRYHRMLLPGTYYISAFPNHNISPDLECVAQTHRIEIPTEQTEILELNFDLSVPECIDKTCDVEQTECEKYENCPDISCNVHESSPVLCWFAAGLLLPDPEDMDQEGVLDEFQVFVDYFYCLVSCTGQYGSNQGPRPPPTEQEEEVEAHNTRRPKYANTNTPATADMPATATSPPSREPDSPKRSRSPRRPTSSPRRHNSSPDIDRLNFHTVVDEHEHRSDVESLFEHKPEDKLLPEVAEQL